MIKLPFASNVKNTVVNLIGNSFEYFTSRDLLFYGIHVLAGLALGSVFKIVFASYVCIEVCLHTYSAYVGLY